MYQDTCCGGGCGTSERVAIGQGIPDFTFDIYHEEKFRTAHFSDFKGKWVVFFFYPADFTFICPTELEEMAAHYAEFQKLNAEVLSVSTDTKFTHKAWRDHSPAIKKITPAIMAAARRRRFLRCSCTVIIFLSIPASGAVLQVSLPQPPCLK